MAAPTHIINELVLEVNTTSLKTAFYLKDNAEVLLKEHIYPQLELWFNSLGNNTDAQIIRFKNLKIETQVDDVESFEDIGIDVLKKIQNQLQIEGSSPNLNDSSIYPNKDSISETGSVEIERTTHKQSKADAVLYFIKNGRLPWWHVNNSFFTAEQVLTSISRDGFPKQFRKLLSEKNQRLRIIHQFDDISIAHMVGSVHTSVDKLKERELKALNFLFQNDRLRTNFWQSTFDYLERKDEGKFVSVLHQIISETSQVTSSNTGIEYKIERTALKNIILFFNFVNTLLAVGFYLKKDSSKTTTPSYSLQSEPTQNRNTTKTKNTEALKSIASSKNKEFRLDLQTKGDTASAISKMESKRHSDSKMLDASENKIPLQSEEVTSNNNVEEASISDEVTDQISSDITTNEITNSTEETYLGIYPNTENQDSSVLVEEGIIFPNAGLILLHPFLQRFFENLNLLDNNAIKPTKLEEAMHILHYLVCKKEQPYEHELLFEKFICNVPLKHPVKRDIQLTDDQKESCEVLLTSALNHWEGLKTNSVDALRSEFLMREGKLLATDEHYKLFVQRKTQDILLETLPWNLSITKIPWKKKMILIDW